MLGLGKLLTLALLVGVALLIYRGLRRLGQARAAPPAMPSQAVNQPAVENVVRCPACGVYVAPGAGACARTGCPNR